MAKRISSIFESGFDQFLKRRGIDNSGFDPQLLAATRGKTKDLLEVSPSTITVVASKAITVESPTTTEDISMFFSEGSITISKITVVLTGSSPSVTWTLRHGTNRNAVGTEVITGGTTTTSTTTGDVITTFDSAELAAASFVWLETTATSGTVNSINITVIYS